MDSLPDSLCDFNLYSDPESLPPLPVNVVVRAVSVNISVDPLPTPSSIYLLFVCASFFLHLQITEELCTLVFLFIYIFIYF